MKDHFYPVVGGEYHGWEFMPPDRPRPYRPVYLDNRGFTTYEWDAKGKSVIKVKRTHHRGRR